MQKQSVFKAFFMGLSIPERDTFAARCHTTRNHLTNVAYGKRPSPELCIEIERESHRFVPVEVMRPDVDWAVIRARRAKNHSTSKVIAMNSRAS